MRIAQYCFTALFVVAAAVQYNDPDPARWIAVYLAAAAVCVFAASTPNAQRPTLKPARARVVRTAALLVGLVALLWAAGIWTGVDHALVPWRMFDQWEMKDIAVEETREIFGLLIVATWMVVTALCSRNRQRSTPDSA